MVSQLLFSACSEIVLLVAVIYYGYKTGSVDMQRFLREVGGVGIQTVGI